MCSWSHRLCVVRKINEGFGHGSGSEGVLQKGGDSFPKFGTVHVEDPCAYYTWIRVVSLEDWLEPVTWYLRSSHLIIVVSKSFSVSLWLLLVSISWENDHLLIRIFSVNEVQCVHENSSFHKHYRGFDPESKCIISFFSENLLNSFAVLVPL